MISEVGVEQLAANDASNWPQTEADREAVRAQLRRILALPEFRNSQRYPRLLECVVEAALLSPPECLKERTLGIQVFGRKPDYDTNQDHIVRTTAAEVRKRLNQYYADAGRIDPVVIELPPGAYVPVLRPANTVAAPAPAVHEVRQVSVRETPPLEAAKGRPYATVLMTLIVTALCALAVFSWANRVPTPVKHFWGQVLASPNPVIVSMGNWNPDSPDKPGATPSSMSVAEFRTAPQQQLNVADAMAAAQLAGFLGSLKKTPTVVPKADARLADLAKGPAVLVGAFSNDWTLRLSTMMRFRFLLDREHATFYIIDSHEASKRDWRMEWETPFDQLTRDYAIISRVLDPTTKQTVTMVAGLASFGTMAAADFISSRESLEALDRVAPAGWEKKNMQAVLSTDVIKGSYGPAQIVAVEVW